MKDACENNVIERAITLAKKYYKKEFARPVIVSISEIDFDEIEPERDELENYLKELDYNVFYDLFRRIFVWSHPHLHLHLNKDENIIDEMIAGYLDAGTEVALEYLIAWFKQVI